MGKWYEKCPQRVRDVVNDLIAEHYPDLAEVELKVDLLFAHAPEPGEGNEKAPALMLHGYPCAATVRVNTLKQRVAGLADATIEIDGDRWNDWDDARQRAILDHELYHLEVRRDEEGNILSDDIGRPKLKLRPHDWQLGGFETIVKRHGDAAVEKSEMKLVADQYGQLLFPWG